MFLRGLFLSLPDIGKLYDIEGLKKNNESWPFVLALFAITNILATASVFVNIFLIHKVEREIDFKSIHETLETRESNIQ